MSVNDYLFAATIISTFGLFVIIAHLQNLKSKQYYMWNGGRCSCGREWIKFSEEQSLGRGYFCDHCREHIWISFRSIDAKREKSL